MPSTDDDTNGGRTTWGAEAEASVAPPCRCEDAIGITVVVAGGRAAMLRLCQWCGDSWQVDGTAVAREAVHSLVPRPRSPLWRCSPPPSRPRRMKGGARRPSCQ